MWYCDLQVPYRQQITKYYCGAAVAKMILTHLNAMTPDQASLYRENHNHNKANWYTDPVGLCWTINHYKPATITHNFVVKSIFSELEQSQALVNRLYTHQLPSAALVFQGSHWVCVRGVSTTNDPLGSYAINGFFVNDPWPPQKSPCHSNTYIAYSYWQSRYMTAVKYVGEWEDRYVCVHYEKEGNLGTLLTPNQKKLNVSLNSARASQLAKEGVEEHGLNEHEDFGAVCNDGIYGDGLLIQSLDVQDGLYYLVSIQDREGILATVMIHGRSGHLLGVQINEDPVRSIMVSSDEARKRILARRYIYYDDNRESIPICKEKLSHTSVLVWRPCLQSLSPYQPFHLFTMGKDRVYVSHDGQIYPELTTLGSCRSRITTQQY